MPQTVHTPDGQTHTFPDSATPEQITQALSRYVTAPAAEPMSLKGFGKNLATDAETNRAAWTPDPSNLTDVIGALAGPMGLQGARLGQALVEQGPKAVAGNVIRGLGQTLQHPIQSFYDRPISTAMDAWVFAEPLAAGTRVAGSLVGRAAMPITRKAWGITGTMLPGRATAVEPFLKQVIQRRIPINAAEIPKAVAARDAASASIGSTLQDASTRGITGTVDPAQMSGLQSELIRGLRRATGGRGELQRAAESRVTDFTESPNLAAPNMVQQQPVMATSHILGPQGQPIQTTTMQRVQQGFTPKPVPLQAVQDELQGVRDKINWAQQNRVRGPEQRVDRAISRDLQGTIKGALAPEPDMANAYAAANKEFGFQSDLEKQLNRREPQSRNRAFTGLGALGAGGVGLGTAIATSGNPLASLGSAALAYGAGYAANSPAALSRIGIGADRLGGALSTAGTAGMQAGSLGVINQLADAVQQDPQKATQAAQAVSTAAQRLSKIVPATAAKLQSYDHMGTFVNTLTKQAPSADEARRRGQLVRSAVDELLARPEVQGMDPKTLRAGIDQTIRDVSLTTGGLAELSHTQDDVLRTYLQKQMSSHSTLRP